MRLIDADALDPELQKAVKEYKSNGAYEALCRLRSAPTIDPESLRPKGAWVVNRKSLDGYIHHRCSFCGTDSPFVYTYHDDWDDGVDGEWYYLGQIEDGIEERMGLYCPNCGARMEG